MFVFAEQSLLGGLHCWPGVAYSLTYLAAFVILIDEPFMRFLTYILASNNHHNLTFRTRILVINYHHTLTFLVLRVEYSGIAQSSPAMLLTTFLRLAWGNLSICWYIPWSRNGEKIKTFPYLSNNMTLGVNYNCLPFRFLVPNTSWSNCFIK